MNTATGGTPRGTGHDQCQRLSSTGHCGTAAHPRKPSMPPVQPCLFNTRLHDIRYHHYDGDIARRFCNGNQQQKGPEGFTQNTSNNRDWITNEGHPAEQQGESPEFPIMPFCPIQLLGTGREPATIPINGDKPAKAPIHNSSKHVACRSDSDKRAPRLWHLGQVIEEHGLRLCRQNGCCEKCADEKGQVQEGFVSGYRGVY